MGLSEIGRRCPSAISVRGTDGVRFHRRARSFDVIYLVRAVAKLRGRRSCSGNTSDTRRS
jgi:hypothetical protein